MKITISSQEQYENAVKNGVKKDDELVLENCNAFIKVRHDVTVGKGGMCLSEGKTEVNIKAVEDGKVTCDGKTNVKAYNEAKVISRGHCKVELNDMAEGNFYGHSKVVARDQSRVNGCEDCTIEAGGEANVAAFDRCKVVVRNDVMAKGYDYTHIKAYDNCIVEATGNCKVEARDNCMVIGDENANIKAQDKCLVLKKSSASVSISDACRVIDMDKIDEKNVMGNIKELSECPIAGKKTAVVAGKFMDNIPENKRSAIDNRFRATGTTMIDYVKKNVVIGDVEEKAETKREGMEFEDRFNMLNNKVEPVKVKTDENGKPDIKFVNESLEESYKDKPGFKITGSYVYKDGEKVEMNKCEFRGSKGIEYFVQLDREGKSVRFGAEKDSSKLGMGIAARDWLKHDRNVEKLQAEKKVSKEVSKSARR